MGWTESPPYFCAATQTIVDSPTHHDFLDDFRWLATTLHDRPTRIFELVLSPTQVIGTTGASGNGLGGTFCINGTINPNQIITPSLCLELPLPRRHKIKTDQRDKPHGHLQRPRTGRSSRAHGRHHDTIQHSRDDRSIAARQYPSCILATTRLDKKHRPSRLPTASACPPCIPFPIYIIT
jgi:hypothetical protein